MRRRSGMATGFLAIAAIAVAAARGLLRRYEVAEASMAPALQPGDYLIAQTGRGVPDRGDIVIFEHPGRAGFELVKRVVGLPGELLTIANGQVHVDGQVLAEPWADGPTYPEVEWRLGDDDVFVLGDARADSSSDGRTLGPVPVAATRWRVRLRYWPIGSAGRVG